MFRDYFDSQIEIEVAPLGLVAKMNTWYLMGKMDGYIKVIKVKDILEVGITEKTFYRDVNFNLELAWKAWCKTYQDHRPSYPVRAKILPELTDKISRYLGEEVKYEIIKKGIEPTGEWVEVNLTFENFFTAREIILNLGRAIEVLEPQALRWSVIDYASQIIAFYQKKSYI
jgi:predicted DNA-binding transcriptional regulator YafY